MEIEYIWEFISLAEELNYHTVAEKRGITAGALSKHIKELESELGSQLFMRTTRNVALSSFGHAFLKEAQQFLRSYQVFMQSVKNMQTAPKNALSIATTLSAMNYNLPKIFSAYLSASFEHSINLHETNTSKARSLLRYGSHNFAFLLSGNKVDPEFASVPVAEDTLALILPSDHPAAQNGEISIHELHDICIHCFPDDGIHSFFSNACTDAGFMPNLELCGAGHSLLIGSVENHHGGAVMTRRDAMRFASPSIAVLTIIPELKIYLNCIYMEDNIQNESSLQFLDFIRNNYHI